VVSLVVFRVPRSTLTAINSQDSFALVDVLRADAAQLQQVRRVCT